MHINKRIKYKINLERYTTNDKMHIISEWIKRIFSNENAVNHCKRFKIFWFISSIIQSMQEYQHVQETGY